MTRWPRFACVLTAAAGLCAAVAAPAQARVHVFFGGGPFWAPPFYAYPPPMYYPPPPVYYAPPPTQWYTPRPVPVAPRYAAPAATAQSCDAGPYVCPMETPVSPGTACWCPNNQGGRTYGHAT